MAGRVEAGGVVKRARAVANRIVQAVTEEITVDTVKRMLFTRYGRLYSRFPSRKVWEWAGRLAKKWGLEGNFPRLHNVFYAVMRSMYKELEFDAGRNVNVGWMFTTAWDIRDAVRDVIEKEVGEHIAFIGDRELEEELYKIVERTSILLYRYARELTEYFTKGVSLGALAWYKAMGLDRGAKLGLLKYTGKGFEVVEKARSFVKEDEFDELWLDEWLGK